MFSSVSCDSREHLVPDTAQQDMSVEPVFCEVSRTNFTNQLQPTIHSGQSTCHFQPPCCEQRNSVNDDCSKKERGETLHQSQSEFETVDEHTKTRPLVNTTLFTRRSCTAQNSNIRETEKHNRNQPSLTAVSPSLDNKEPVSEEANQQHEPTSTNDSVDEVRRIINQYLYYFFLLAYPLFSFIDCCVQILKGKQHTNSVGGR